MRQPAAGAAGARPLSIPEPAPLTARVLKRRAETADGTGTFRGGSACAKAAAKAVKALDKAEGKDDCIVTDPAVDAVVDDFVQELLDTLNPPPVICCSNGLTCFYAADAPGCAAAPLSATAGAEGSVCTGSGACAPPPAAAGGCCEDAVVSGLAFDCLGGTFGASECGSAGGAFSTAICTPSGSCQ